MRLVGRSGGREVLRVDAERLVRRGRNDGGWDVSGCASGRRRRWGWSPVLSGRGVTWLRGDVGVGRGSVLGDERGGGVGSRRFGVVGV